jgi:sigma-B regulation protein RsbU (phosphoserine phosphatase)
MFTTAFVGYLDLDSGEFQYASAGHNPPLVYRAATGRCESLTAKGVAMGLFKEAEYTQKTITLAAGDILVLYTDGITETINAQEQEFGQERLIETVIRQAADSARELSEQIIHAAAHFASGQTPSTTTGSFDDETLVVIKRNTQGQQICLPTNSEGKRPGGIQA